MPIVSSRVPHLSFYSHTNPRPQLNFADVIYSGRNNAHAKEQGPALGE